MARATRRTKRHLPASALQECSRLGRGCWKPWRRTALIAVLLNFRARREAVHRTVTGLPIRSQWSLVRPDLSLGKRPRFPRVQTPVAVGIKAEEALQDLRRERRGLFALRGEARFHLLPRQHFVHVVVEVVEERTNRSLRDIAEHEKTRVLQLALVQPAIASDVRDGKTPAHVCGQLREIVAGVAFEIVQVHTPAVEHREARDIELLSVKFAVLVFVCKMKQSGGLIGVGLEPCTHILAADRLAVDRPQ
mmetsp:Transcript_102017/g.295213  ORF Transcript_102017/g.295213 Transcript_102017/m.295213 type:complete len:249 (-) Transcript_102017:443-1189(-)